MGITVYAEPIRRKYTAPCCSLSFCFHILCLVGIIIVPFYVAYASGNFWLKRNILFEQPDIKFQYDIMFVMQGTSSDDPTSFKTWIWDTIPEVRSTFEPYLRASIVRAWPTDENDDGIADTWTVTVQMPLNKGDKVYQVDALAMFSYELSGRAPLLMDSMAYINYASPIPGRGLNIEADASLRQKQALSVRRDYANPELKISRVVPAQLHSHLVSTMVSSYAKRNFTMELSNSYKVWNTIAAMDEFSPISDSFLLNFTLRVPPQQVVYIPDVPEVLKVAWIQYFAIGFIFFVLFLILESFVFSNQVLETTVHAEGDKRNARRGHTF